MQTETKAPITLDDVLARSEQPLPLGKDGVITLGDVFKRAKQSKPVPTMTFVGDMKEVFGRLNSEYPGTLFSALHRRRLDSMNPEEHKNYIAKLGEIDTQARKNGIAEHTISGVTLEVVDECGGIAGHFADMGLKCETVVVANGGNSQGKLIVTDPNSVEKLDTTVLIKAMLGKTAKHVTLSLEDRPGLKL